MSSILTRRVLRVAKAARLSSSAAAPTQQPVQFVARELTEEHLRKIGERDEALRKAYDVVRDQYSPHAQGEGAPIDKHEAFRKRLLYRSKQRGWLEVDLLMGAWADKHIAGLSRDELVEYERILNRETLDLYNMVTGKDAVPAELSGSVMDSIQRFVASSPLGKADPRSYEEVKRIMSN